MHEYAPLQAVNPMTSGRERIELQYLFDLNQLEFLVILRSSCTVSISLGGGHQMKGITSLTSKKNQLPRTQRALA